MRRTHVLTWRFWWLLWSGEFFAGCVDAEPRPCERLRHLTKTGHVEWCDCTCDDDPAFACSAAVVECERPELVGRTSAEFSESDGGSTE